MVGRSIDPPVKTGDVPANHEVIYGLFDSIIDCGKTRNWFTDNGIGATHFHQEFMGHRTPLSIFVKHVKEFTNC
jgi:hypothetical protein